MALMKEMWMRFGSVCSGIEAASVAWHHLGWNAAWVAEVDVSASAVLAHRLGASAPRFPLAGSEKSLKRIRFGDQIVNWGDMTHLPAMIRSGDAEAPDILCGGTPCFTAGHMVLTSTGHKAIEEVLPGDMVATHLGRFRPVLRVGSKQAEVGDWVAVGQSSGITCTADHPFYVSADLSRSTRLHGKSVRVKEFGPMEWRAASETAGMFWSAIVEFQCETAMKVIPQPHGLSRAETMRLLGWYLGDGWVRSRDDVRKKQLCFGIPDVKVTAFREAFPTLHQAASENGVTKRIAIGCSDLCEWIIAHLGSGASKKTIPGWMLSDPDRHELLAGYVATDGCTHANGAIVMKSVSERLSRGVAALAQTLGYAATVTKVIGPTTTVIEGRVVNQRPYFTCSLFPENRSRKSHREHGLLLRKVQSFTPIGSDTVFNIEVAEDNSFILNGAVVHNCQGFSIAGLRGGLSDPRGQLTLSFVELANAIDDRRASRGQHPCAVFWENVPGVRSDSGNAFGHFLAGLVGVEDPIEPGPRPEPGRSSAHWTWKEETCEHVAKWPSAGVVAGPRRTVGWRSFDAQFFGLAQRRERVFVVASAREGFDPQVVLFEFDSLRRDSAPSRETGEDVAGTLAARTDGGGFPGTDEACSGYVQPVASAELVGALDTECGFSKATMQSVYAGHQVPGIADAPAPTWWDGSPVSQTLDAVLHKGQTMPEKNRFPAVLQPISVFDPNQITNKTSRSTPTPELCHTLPATPNSPVTYSVALRGREGGGTAELGDDLAGALRASSGGGDKPHVLVVHGTQDPDIRVDLAHTLGRNSGQENAVCVTGDITHALKADGFDGSEDGTGIGQPIVPAIALTTEQTPKFNEECALTLTKQSPTGGGQIQSVLQDMAVRRLMPVECERLMGFPDGHTLVPVGKGMAADGPRYKQLGNSWAVPCVSWIGDRLARHMAELASQVIEAVPVTMNGDALCIWMCAA